MKCKSSLREWIELDYSSYLSYNFQQFVYDKWLFVFLMNILDFHFHENPFSKKFRLNFSISDGFQDIQQKSTWKHVLPLEYKYLQLITLLWISKKILSLITLLQKFMSYYFLNRHNYRKFPKNKFLSHNKIHQNFSKPLKWPLNGRYQCRERNSRVAVYLNKAELPIDII